MTSGDEQRDRRAEEILDAALKLPAEEIEDFIASECAGDTVLFAAVQQQLDALHTVFSSSPASGDAARPSTQIGEKPAHPATLGHYRIREKIGQGGMGAVYLAVDTHLDRLVAVKVLPPKSVRDPDRRRRFEREAKAISALSHPNIVSVFDFGSTVDGDYIAMEYVKGPTLEQVLADGRPDLDDALNYAGQTAAAIAAAHAGGVIHRDIKPANIMLGQDGLIKVLDFGLAKLTQPRDSLLAEPGENAAPEDALKTIAGTIAGTVNYMSPEQAEGKFVDVRSDIFSLGAVLYELVTGRKAFQGDSHISVLSKILHAEPPRASERAEGVSASLENLICRCIEKDPARRYQTMDEVVAALESVERGEYVQQLPPAGGEAKTNRSRARWTALAGLAAAALIAILVWNSRHTPPQSAPPPLPVPFTTYRGTEAQPVFSPDGNSVAFIWDGENGVNNDVYLKAVGGGAPVRLTTNPGREHSPAWSPDGSLIAYCRSADGRHAILAMPSEGGDESEIGVSLADGVSFGMDWRPDGQFLAIVDRDSDSEPNAIFLLNRANGEKQRLTTPPAASAGDTFPKFSPDGRRLAFLRFVDANRRVVHVLNLASGKETSLESDAAAGVAWTADGRELVFSSRRLGLERISADGSVPQPVPVGDEFAYYPAISKDGKRLAYSRWIHNTNIWRTDLPDSDSLPASQSGNVKWISSTRRQDSPNISADSKRIAFVSDRSGYIEIWLADADGGNPVQLTAFGGPNTGTPRWSPSGEWIAFDSRPAGNADIFVISSGGGAPRPITTEASQDIVPSWSGDGRWIYFASDRTGERQIWKAPLDGGEAVQVTRHGGFEAFESADGAYVYYTRENNRAGVWRVPVEGGEESPVTGLEGAAKSRYWALTAAGVYFVPSQFSEQVSDVVFVSFFDFATRRIVQAAAFGHLVSGPSGLAVSADGRFLLYTQEDQNDRDIVLVENFH